MYENAYRFYYQQSPRSVVTLPQLAVSLPMTRDCFLPDVYSTGCLFYWRDNDALSEELHKILIDHDTLLNLRQKHREGFKCFCKAE